MAAGYCYCLGIKSFDFFLKDNKKAFTLGLNVPKVTAYYCDLENIIDEVTPDLHWARVRFSVRRVLQVLLWILSAVASGFVSILLADFF